MGTMNIDNCVKETQEMGAFLMGLKCPSLEDEEGCKGHDRISPCGFKSLLLRLAFIMNFYFPVGMNNCVLAYQVYFKKLIELYSCFSDHVSSPLKLRK